MKNIEMKIAKNGSKRYYVREENGKLTAISRSKAIEIQAAANNTEEKVRALFVNMEKFNFGSYNEDFNRACKLIGKMFNEIDEHERNGHTHTTNHPFANDDERAYGSLMNFAVDPYDYSASYCVYITHDGNSVSFNRQALKYLVNYLLTKASRAQRLIGYYLNQTDAGNIEDYVLNITPKTMVEFFSEQDEEQTAQSTADAQAAEQNQAESTAITKEENIMTITTKENAPVEADVNDYAVTANAQNVAIDEEIRLAFLAQKATEKAAGNYTETINGERVTFKNFSIVEIIAPKLGFGYSTKTGKGKFYNLDGLWLIYRPVAKTRIFERYAELELAATQIVDAKNFFGSYTSGNDKDFFKVGCSIKFADGSEHYFVRYFNYFNQAQDFADAVSEKYADTVEYFLAIDRNHINENHRYYQCDREGNITRDIPNTDFYNDLPASKIQAQIDEINRAIEDNEKFAVQSEHLIWSILMTANHALLKTRTLLKFALHENENAHQEPAEPELNNAREKFLNVRENHFIRLDDFSGKKIWYVDGVRSSKTNVEKILAEFGLTPTEYLAEQDKWIAENFSKAAAQIAVEEQAEFLHDKIQRERKPLDDESAFKLLPALDELNDVEDDAESEYSLAAYELLPAFIHANAELERIEREIDEGIKQDKDVSHLSDKYLAAIKRVGRLQRLFEQPQPDSDESESNVAEHAKTDFSSKLAELKATYDEAEKITAAKKLAVAKAEKEYNAAADISYAALRNLQTFLSDAKQQLEKELLTGIEQPSDITITAHNGLTYKTKFKDAYFVFGDIGEEISLMVYKDAGYTTWKFATYDTPEQIKAAIDMLKAAIARGDKEFSFPTDKHQPTRKKTYRLKKLTKRLIRKSPRSLTA